MGNRCINLNNQKVQDIAKELGIPPALAASKIEVWMDDNGGKIPTVEDIIGDRFYNLTDHSFVYERYPKLLSGGKIKQFSKTEAERIAKSFDRSTNYIFKAVKYIGDKWRVLIYKPFDSNNDDLFVDPQIALFDVEGAEPNNLTEYFKTNEGKSQDVLKQIAKMDNGLGAVAKQLLKVGVDIPIEIVDTKRFTKGNLPPGVNFQEYLGDTFVASAIYHDNKIYIAKNATFRSGTEAILLHEILHGYTAYYLKNSNSAAVQNLQRLLNHLNKPEIKEQMSDKYPLSDMDEMLVAIFTNPTFIKDLKELPATTKNFKSVWDEILNTFKVIFGIKDVTLFDEIFAASSVVVDEAMTEIQANEEYNEYRNVALASKADDRQIVINNKLDELQKKVSKIDEQYQVEGYNLDWKRPSQASKGKIQSNFIGTKSTDQLEMEAIYQEAGTILHGIQANIIKEAFPEFNKHLEEFIVPESAIEFVEVMKEQLKPIIKQAKDRGSVLKAEVFIGNSKSENAGTVDLLEITPDGNYYIYDLKTRFTADKSGKRRFNKILEWSEQTGIYKEMLVAGDAQLGVIKGKVEGVYILELKVDVKNDNIVFSGNVGYKKTNTDKYLSKRKLTDIKIVAPTFMRTSDKKVDDLIDRLLIQINNLRKQKDSNPDTQIINNEILQSKIELLQDLQLKQDVSKLISHGYIELYDIEKMIDMGEIKNNSQFIKEQIEFYKNVVTAIEDVSPEMEIKLLKLQKLANSLDQKYTEFRNKTIEEGAKNNGVLATLGKMGKELFGAVSDVGWLSRMTLGVSDIDNPLIQSAHRTVSLSIAKAREKTQKVFDKLKDVTAKFKADGHSFDILVEGDSLVGKYQKGFWLEKKEAESHNDYDWFEDNTSFDKEAYQAARERQLDFFDAYKETYVKAYKVEHPGTSDSEIDVAVSKMIADKMRIWDDTNKGNKSKFFIPNKSWMNPKYVEIKEGKYKGTSVEEMYDLFTSIIESANEIMPEKVKKNFIPNFLKEYTEKLENMNSLSFFQNGLINLDSIESTYDEGQYGKRDSVTGEILNELYIPGIESIENKSLDLPLVFYKFIEGVYRYEELREVEHLVMATKDYLRKDAKFYATNNLGQKIDIIDNYRYASNISQAYDSWVDSVFYGKRKKDEAVFEVKGNGFTNLMFGIKKGDTKKLSVAKMVDKFIHYVTLRNLGFNLYSPIVNLFGGTANMYMTGASGKYYSSADLTKAMNLSLGGVVNFPNEDVKKARLIIEWLNLNNGEFQKKQESELSSLKTKKILQNFNALSLMGVSEDIMRDAGGLAMVLSGNYDFKWDSFKVEDGKLVINTDLLTKESFRQKIIKVNQSNIGGINSDDMMEAKQYIVGRLLMQHRSWLPALAAKRFGKRKFNWTMEEEMEGRYRTVYKTFKHLFNKEKYQALSAMEKQNLKEAGVELAMIIGTTLLLALLKGATDDEDKKKAWYKIAQKVSSRGYSELIFFVDPTFESQYQILLSPAAALGTVGDFGNLVKTVYKDEYGTEEQQKRAKPGKKAIKLIPGVNKVEAFLNDLGVTE